MKDLQVSLLGILPVFDFDFWWVDGFFSLTDSFKICILPPPRTVIDYFCTPIQLYNYSTLNDSDTLTEITLFLYFIVHV